MQRQFRPAKYMVKKEKLHVHLPYSADGKLQLTVTLCVYITACMLWFFQVVFLVRSSTQGYGKSGKK